MYGRQKKFAKSLKFRLEVSRILQIIPDVQPFLVPCNTYRLQSSTSSRTDISYTLKLEASMSMAPVRRCALAEPCTETAWFQSNRALATQRYPYQLQCTTFHYGWHRLKHSKASVYLKMMLKTPYSSPLFFCHFWRHASFYPRTVPPQDFSDPVHRENIVQRLDIYSITILNSSETVP